MSKGMFCLEKASPGFGGSVGEKAWQLRHVNQLRTILAHARYCKAKH